MPQRLSAPASHVLLRPAIALLLAMSAACGGDGGASRDGSNAASTGGKEQAARAGGAAATCANADTSALALAVREFITKASPTPQRFLNAVGTDSALPDDGFKVLQDKGPTYFYSSDSAAQRQVKDKLAMAGPYASLLVVYRGQTATDGGVDIRLGGHYVGGEHDGKLASTKRYGVRCDSTGWRIASTAEESGA